MSLSYFSPRWLRSRVVRIVLAVCVTLPLAFSAVYMWAMWDPTHKVDQLPVALVDSDQPVGQGAEAIHAGRDVTAQLLESGALDWKQVDHDQAQAGVRDGKYYFAIEIPRDFSRTIANIGKTTHAPAQIDVTFNDNTATYSGPIGKQVMSEIDKAVLSGVSTQVADTVLVGLNSVGNGLRTAADGAGQLKDGTGQLVDGADQLHTGVTRDLAPGMAEATKGGHDLAAGAGQLKDGLGTLQAGTDTLGAGARQLSDGIDQLVSKVDDSGDLAAQAAALHRQLAALPGPIGQQGAQVLGMVDELLDGLQRLRAGSHEITRQLTDPAADYRSGVDKLVAGSGDLKAGADRLSAGLDQLDAGVGRVADGSTQLADGAHRLDTGAGQLDAGLAAGVKQVPDLNNPTVRTSLASLVSTPVVSDAHNLARAQDLGPGVAPAMLAIASVLAALVVWMTFRADRDPAQDLSGRSSGYRLFRRLLAVGFISVVAMAAVTASMWLILSPAPSPANIPQLLVVVAVGTVMAMSLVGLAYTVFGYIAGTLVSLAVLMLQTFAFGGVWMIETVPAPFRWLHPIAPMTYMRKGLMAAFSDGQGFGSAVLVMVAIAAAAIGLQYLFIQRGWNRYPHKPGRAMNAHTERTLEAQHSMAY
ncbi:YhgE/Pip domain-containing protein [Rhodococcus sp. D2-41]|uniref:YhgE/Pip domain-containing protein n=1 Tax=Speluncibacter jeojiensis TaxID=2710754 RepID=UPI00240F4DFB|nr:YhgE/Pip domain-containing protein [Rhodococcus sp. D2-41]MDG3012765.1 YhgE/Pip domain-containing protein [Rhodococcus sp. D2-41]